MQKIRTFVDDFIYKVSNFLTSLLAFVDRRPVYVSLLVPVESQKPEAKELRKELEEAETKARDLVENGDAPEEELNRIIDRLQSPIFEKLAEISEESMEAHIRLDTIQASSPARLKDGRLITMLYFDNYSQLYDTPYDEFLARIDKYAKIL